jgi:electron transfer flavoprotein alpha/beta subunit
MAKGVMRLERGLDRGFRELVETLLPAVASISENGSSGPASCVLDISAAALLAAEAQELLVWNLSDLGVTVEEIRRAERSLRYGYPRPRHPKLRHIPAPNPELPAFDRILKLIEGSLQRREGRVVREPAEVLVEEIFQTLKNEGWLDHLRSGDDSCEERSTGGRE